MLNITDFLPYTIYSIKGHSMEPTIKEGSRVFVFQWAYAFKEPKEGEVIIFRHNQEHWIKRIKKIEGERIEVEGDNENDSQKIGAVRKKDIIGKVLR